MDTPAALKTYEEFKRAIRVRESGNDYCCVNKWGYLGAYQFSMARLCDIGLTVRKPGKTGMSHGCFDWAAGGSEAGFLSSPEVQDACFDVHVAMLKKRLEKVLREGSSMSGAIAACHLVGYQGFLQWYAFGRVKKDALGTTAASYYEKFTGYAIP